MPEFPEKYILNDSHNVHKKNTVLVLLLFSCFSSSSFPISVYRFAFVHDGHTAQFLRLKKVSDDNLTPFLPFQY